MTELVDPAAAAYAESRTTPPDEDLAAVAAWTTAETDVPQMMSGLPEARLLEALVAISGATRVLEVGTFTGFGALAMAAALGAGGRVTTIEANPDTAAQAQRHFDASPLGERIELVTGDALEVLETLPGPFDLVYLDAWKADYPAYYALVAPKLSGRGVIVADNVLRGGRVLDDAQDDEGTEGVRRFAARVQEDPAMRNVLLTVGDGLMVAWRAGSG
jgi:caffeoyl-CoA O-methyltransferase